MTQSYDDNRRGDKRPSDKSRSFGKDRRVKLISQCTQGRTLLVGSSISCPSHSCFRLCKVCGKESFPSLTVPQECEKSVWSGGKCTIRQFRRIVRECALKQFLNKAEEDRVQNAILSSLGCSPVVPDESLSIDTLWSVTPTQARDHFPCTSDDEIEEEDEYTKLMNEISMLTISQRQLRHEPEIHYGIECIVDDMFKAPEYFEQSLPIIQATIVEVGNNSISANPCLKVLSPIVEVGINTISTTIHSRPRWLVVKPDYDNTNTVYSSFFQKEWCGRIRQEIISSLTLLPSVTDEDLLHIASRLCRKVFDPGGSFKSAIEGLMT